MAGRHFLKDLGHWQWDIAVGIFTVGGVIASLILVKEYTWLSGLILFCVFAAAHSFAWARHRQLVSAEAAHEAERGRLQGQAAEAAQRAAEAERKLAEAPLDILTKVQAAVEASSYADAAARLKRYADLVDRMRQFVSHLIKPLIVRTVTRQGDRLYFAAKAPRPALECLRPGDPFQLVRRGEGDLETPAANLTVHQPPDLKKEVVHFALESSLSDEVAALEALAAHGEIPGSRYGIRLVCDPSRYGNLRLADLPGAIDYLMADFFSPPGGAT